MASEAELERLYQEFVNRGGGAFTFSNVTLHLHNIIVQFLVAH